VAVEFGSANTHAPPPIPHWSERGPREPADQSNPGREECNEAWRSGGLVFFWFFWGGGIATYCILLSFAARMYGHRQAVRSLAVARGLSVCGWLRTLPPPLLDHAEIASGATVPSQKGAAQVHISGKVPNPGADG
jgi:hypothetical protein